jgi:prolipoprotein diacylglyceryltransferase
LFYERHAKRLIDGVVTALAMIVWGIVRSIDEKLLLGQQSHSGSDGVQIAGVVLALAGVLLLIRQVRAARSTQRP